MLQIYTGNGKGKTTAAVGLAIRAAGAGLKVFFAQFMKNTPSAELEIFRLLGEKIVFRQYGTGKFIVSESTEEDRKCALEAFSEVEQAIVSKNYGLIIADELCTALYFNLIDISNLQRLLEDCPSDMELVFTGRGAPQELIERADLVTEMREIKHYFSRGIEARKGIEF